MTHEERFWAKVDRDGPDGCWLWLGHANSDQGYGRFNYDHNRTLAHRYAYELLVGPIPAGLTLDHLCRVTLCVNPAHLEPVTLAENVLRSECPPALNARKTTCKRGHPFDDENTYHRPDGGRECKTCRAQHIRNYHSRHAA